MEYCLPLKDKGGTLKTTAHGGESTMQDGVCVDRGT